MKNRLSLKYIILIAACMAAVNISSCRKFIQIPPPTSSLITTEIFADSTDATAAINGIYANMMYIEGSADIANGNTTIFGGLSADELSPTSLNTYQYPDFYNDAILITDAYDNTFWNGAYTYIYQANACIAGATNSTTLSTTLKNRIIGQAEFIRAFMHFYLVNFYGPVPLVTTTDYKITSSLPRASVSDIYAQINTDLANAGTLLANDPLAINKVTANRFAVAAFLARVNLYEQKWAAAEAAATTVISTGNYSLVPVLNNVFLVGSQEQIWQMTPPYPGDETTEGQLFIPYATTAVPNFTVTPGLLSSFEANDQRSTAWLAKNTVAGTTYTYPFKYKLTRDGAATPKEAYSMLRLGEQYLIRAEARAEQNELSGAISDLNMIRARAGLPNTTATSQADVLTAIAHERRIELMCEWGHRWLDLKRTNTVDAVMAIVKPTFWKSTAALYPIPFTQMQQNPFLVQNPGY